MNIHKDLRNRIEKHFGRLDSIPAGIRDFVDELNSDYYRLSEPGHDWYRILADNVTDVIWAMDLSMNLRYVSPSCLTLTGYTDSEMLLMRTNEFLTLMSLESAKAMLDHELENEKSPEADPHRAVLMDVEFRRKNGSTVWAEVRVTFLRKGGVPSGLVGVARDITQRRNAEQKLRRHEEQYRMVLETIKDGYYEVDLTGRYLFYNSAYCDMIGYPPDEVSGMSYRDIFPEEEQRKIFEIFHSVFIDGKSNLLDLGRFRMKDGTYRYGEGTVSLRYDQEGKKIGFCGIMRDVTERHLMEEAIRESEQKWRSLYSSIPGGSFIISRDCTITDVNSITCGITGFRYDELIGEKCQFICTEDPQACSCPITMKEDEKIVNTETALKTKDGRKVPIIKSAQGIKGVDDDIILVNFHDISRMKEIEDALRASEDTMRKRNEVIEKDLLAAQLIQRSLMAVNLPKLEYVKMDYRFLPLDAVGGDYFSFIPLREGGLGVFIGDVSSHGVTAALYLSLVKVTFERICRDHALQPLKFINMLNAELYENMPLSFLTATYGVFGSQPGGETTFTFCSAGHPYPVLCPADGGEPEFLRCRGTLIGMFDKLDFQERTITLRKGDRIFLYTDGIPETINEKKELIGYDYMPELIGRCKRETLESSLDAVIDEINTFRGGEHHTDDIILLGFEVLADGSSGGGRIVKKRRLSTAAR